MPRTDRLARVSDLLDNARPFHLLQNILTFYLDLPCFLIRPPLTRDWHTLVSFRSDRLGPMDFENVRQWKARFRYNEQSLAKAARTGKPVCEAMHGLHGLFVPVMRGKRCLGILQSGVFLTRRPDEETLFRLWKAISGRGPAPEDSVFLQYARALFATPVLDPPLVRGLAKILGLFGAFLAGEQGSAEVSALMAAIQTDVFARRLWHRGWLHWHVLNRTFFNFGEEAKVLQPWEKEELGIQRFPTTVLLARCASTGREWTDLLAAAKLVAAARNAAPGFKELLAFPYGSEGVLLLTSVDPKDAKEGDAEILQKARRFGKTLSRILKRKVWIGGGRSDSDGTRLAESFHEAVAALHLAVSQDRDVVLYGEVGAAPVGDTTQRHQMETLVQTAVEKGLEGISTLLDVYVRDTVIRTRSRPEVARRVFLETIHRLLSELESGQGFAAVDIQDLESRVNSRLEEAVGFKEMVEQFRSCFALLQEALERPAVADTLLRIRRACDAIRSAPQAAWSLGSVAHRFGFSSTTFSRAFSRHTGTSFSTFVLERRLEKAYRMLREGRPQRQVALACGFSSASYFSQVFKRVQGVAPSRFVKGQHPSI